MENETEPSDEFLVLGTYTVVDLRKLLTALETGNVDFRVEFRDGSADANAHGSFGQAAQATVSIAPQDKEIADRIHAELFGDCLPNYDAEFFRNPENVDETQH